MWKARHQKRALWPSPARPDAPLPLWEMDWRQIGNWLLNMRAGGVNWHFTPDDMWGSHCSGDLDCGVLGHYPVPSAEEAAASIIRSLEDEGSKLLLNTGNYQQHAFSNGWYNNWIVAQPYHIYRPGRTCAVSSILTWRWYNKSPNCCYKHLKHGYPTRDTRLCITRPAATRARAHTQHTHTHTHIYIYIYI